MGGFRARVVSRRYRLPHVLYGVFSTGATSDGKCDRARKTLKDTGGRDISAESESAADFGTTDKPTERAPATVLVRDEVLPDKQVVEFAAPETKK